MAEASLLIPPEDLWRLANARLDQGDMIGTLDALEKLPKDWRREPRVRRLEARSFAQGGQPRKARRMLEELLHESPSEQWHLGNASPADIYALIGRTWKDEWELCRGTSAEDEVLACVIDSYQESYSIAGSSDDQFYAAINLATFAHIAGRSVLATTYARLVLKLCADAEARQDMWRFASLAEAHALLGNVESALDAYASATRCGSPRLRDLCSARKQARLVAAHTGHEPTLFDAAFNLPSIVVFAGHRLDAPNRQAERLPLRAMTRLREELDDELKRLNAGIGYSSAAAGADIVFLEAMRARAAETHVLLSSPVASFRATNVDGAEGAGWGTRFQSALDYAEGAGANGSVTAANPHEPCENSITYGYANLIMSGQAWHRARTLDLDLHPMAVWDGLPGDGPGGTADFCNLWQSRGYGVQLIPPERLFESSYEVRVGDRVRAPQTAPGLSRSSFRQEIKAILIADVKNFTHLSENQVELFSRHYLGRVSALIARADEMRLVPPLFCNTWGDAFYMVFDTVRDAGCFALRLQSELAPPPDGKADWAASGLPEALTIRIALHAGPVFLYSDPVVRNLAYTGRHVSFAARLEPVTMPGQIYASEAFTAMAVMDDVRDFRCAYVGLRPAPKGFGVLRAYSLIDSGVAPL